MASSRRHAHASSGPASVLSTEGSHGSKSSGGASHLQYILTVLDGDGLGAALASPTSGGDPLLLAHQLDQS